MAKTNFTGYQSEVICPICTSHEHIKVFLVTRVKESGIQSFERQTHKMVKHTQLIRLLN